MQVVPNKFITTCLHTRLVVDTIATFDVHVLDDKGATTSYDSRESVEAIYLSDVAARLACKRRGIQLNVVRMINDFDILVVSRVGGNDIQVVPKCVMMDSGTQPIMIGKKLAKEL